MAPPPASLRLATSIDQPARTLMLDHPCIMGILNVTPDSFSDGGSYTRVESALAQARVMLSQGADLIDVGGESTRPGAEPVSEAEQIRRVVPVIQAMAELRGQYHQAWAISVDTTRAAVAQAALDAGASIINDISAGLDDPALLPLAAATEQPIVLMHMQGRPATMQKNPQYQDVVREVIDFLLARAEAAQAAGVARSQIILDPGIGFGKTREHNLVLLAHLDQLVKTGYPILLGTSRKRFMGSLSKAVHDKSIATLPPPEPGTLIGATCATTAWGVSQGVKLFRVHDVQPNRQAADVAHALMARSLQ
jgi:dihydropteroate synthase